MAKVYTKFRRENAIDLALEIYTDKEYTKIVENLGLQDKIKEIIVEHGPFTDSEIGVFVEENLKRPVLEEIFDDFNGNKDKKRHEKIWRDSHTSSHARTNLPGIFRRQ